MLGAAKQIVVVPDELQLCFVGIAPRGPKKDARHRYRRASQERLSALDSHVGGETVEGVKERQTATLGRHRIRNLPPSIAEVHAPEARHSVEILPAANVLYAYPLTLGHDPRTVPKKIRDGCERVEKALAIDLFRALAIERHVSSPAAVRSAWTPKVKVSPDSVSLQYTLTGLFVY